MAQTGTLPKPQLRGLLASRLKINATAAFAFCISMAVGWKFLFAEKRKQKYLDFYKSYDAKADFERMKKAGVFQSVRPDGEIGTLD
ncbi:cytochrome c oxidase subunit 6C-like [Pomacea canaliculata]|uniref:cytochrome c oxidase subunit 6C-like n=1 Tax=Pomacea canaliculata TaxID=400727 RepID=UPI000D731902|nr:cytochrome c oxidase subunit 6C-like [Pomacea canaliculata]XP_025076884.1 cytochrome c oxidase subunit 6C-like [Pomacea canaliculata]